MPLLTSPDAPQVELAADPATGLYTLTFTDSQQQRYRATKLHFGQFCEVSEELVVGRGAGRQEVLVSFASRAADARALHGTGTSLAFPGLEVAPACRPAR